jgi:hypothetical protein
MGECRLGFHVYDLSLTLLQALFAMTTSLLMSIALSEINPPGVADQDTVNGILTVCYSSASRVSRLNQD